MVDASDGHSGYTAVVHGAADADGTCRVAAPSAAVLIVVRTPARMSVWVAILRLVIMPCCITVTVGMAMSTGILPGRTINRSGGINDRRSDMLPHA